LNPNIFKLDLEEQILCIKELKIEGENQSDILIITEKQIKIISSDLQ
jgi:hypothetical protein